MKKYFLVSLLCLFSLGNQVHTRRQLLESNESTTLSSTTAVTESHNDTTTLTPKNTTKPHNNGSTSVLDTGQVHQPGTDAAIAVISIIVVATIFLMAVYFIRKFEQLNRLVPSYRYSSLKTEINGVGGIDDKLESQALVSASTEEEDDYDDEEIPSPPTLLVQSQTTMVSSKIINGTAPSNTVTALPATQIKDMMAIDSDDELLQ